MLNKKLYINLFLVWIFISSFYYAPNFISGDLIVDRNSDLIHKSLKYLVAIIFSICHILLWKSLSLILLYILLFFYLLVAFTFILFDYPSMQFFDTVIVLISFIGFIYIGSKFNKKNIAILSTSITIAALILSSISFYEFFFGVDYLNDYWNNTGGYRSISLLLNPNNLGFYLGASIIVLFINKSVSLSSKIIITVPIIFALFLSGSRSAMLSFFIVSFYLYIAKNNIISINRLIKFIFIFILFSLLILLFIYFFNFNLPYRFNNFYTFETRIDKYYFYFNGIGLNYFYPDIFGQRVELVADNSYYHFINSLGLIPAVFLLVFSFLILNKYLNIKLIINYKRPFSFLVFYYLLGMFFDNILMSFPNNQLFFLAVGLGLIREKES